MVFQDSELFTKGTAHDSHIICALGRRRAVAGRMGKGERAFFGVVGGSFFDVVDGWETLAGFASPGIFDVVVLGDQGTFFLFFLSGLFFDGVLSWTHILLIFFLREAKMRDVVTAMALRVAGRRGVLCVVVVIDSLFVFLYGGQVRERCGSGFGARDSGVGRGGSGEGGLGGVQSIYE